MQPPIELMNILITLICHLEQKHFDLTTNKNNYLLDCVEHSRQENVKPNNIVHYFKRPNEKSKTTIAKGISDLSNHTLKSVAGVDLKSNTDNVNTTSNDLISSIKVSNSDGIQSKEDDIGNISENENNASTDTKTNTNDLIIPVKEAEARIVMDSTKVADGTEKPEDILNDGTPQDDIKIPEKKDHGTSPVPEEDVSIRKIQEDMASTIAPSNNNLMDSITQNEGLGGVAHQVSPNRQPLLAAQFEEKLESSPSNEVVYICVNATCDANNTMDPLAKLILVQSTTRVNAIRIRNINLEAPYDTGYLECDWEEFTPNTSTRLNGPQFFTCSVRTRWKQFEYDWKYLFSLLFIGAGGVGNILVCLAICLDKSLQNVTNYFLLSLALADLLVSVLVMPLGAVPGFFGYWPLSVPLCNVYLTSDVLACSCSIMHMCCISLGRYLGIRNPLKTRHTYSTKKLVGIKIAIVWCLSLCVGGSITLLGLYNPNNIMQTGKRCAINNRAFFLFGSLVAFYIPMLIMVISYALTVQLLRQKAELCLPPTFRTLGGKQNKLRANQPSNLKVDQQTQTPQVIDKFRFPPILVNFRLLSHIKEAKQRRRERRLRPAAVNSVRTEQKASKVLGLVFFTFVLCWAPFFLLQILQALIPQGYYSIPEDVAILCLWLGYFSSILNPIIYTIFNRTFRAAFIRLLKCQCGKVSKPIRYRSVQDRTVSSGPSAQPLMLNTGHPPPPGRSLSVSAQDLNPSYPTSTKV